MIDGLVSHLLQETIAPRALPVLSQRKLRNGLSQAAWAGLSVQPSVG